MILTFIPPHPLVFITLLPIAFSLHLSRVHVHSLPAFRRFFITLAPAPATSSNKPKGKGSSLVVVLMLSKSLQYGTNRLCLLHPGQNRSSSRAANCMVRDRHRNLNLPVLRRLFQIVALRLPQQLQ
ncbi:hypothetical protein EV424DRAFT_1449615 [Suillus variegatus]|nr:hypothetical protein EV424DRAFT_1449615 [Suillus variegatus]